MHFPSTFRRLLCVLLLLCVTAPVRAAEDVLALMPKETLGFVLFNRADQASKKVTKWATALQIPIPDPLVFFKTAAGIKTGLDEKGNALLVMVPGEAGVKDAFPLAFLPVTNFAEFVKQFGAQDPSEAIIKVPVAGAPVLIAKKGAYAVFAEPEHEDALKTVIDAKPGVLSEVAAIRSWLDRNDVSAAIAPNGVKLLITEGLNQLDSLGGQLGEAPDEVAGQLRAALEMYRLLGSVFRDEIAVAGLGLLISDASDLHVTARANVNPSGKLAETVKAGKSLGAGSLNALPGDDYVFAAGANIQGLVSKAVMQWSIDWMKANPGLYGFKKLTDDEAEKLAAIGTGALADVQSIGFSIGPGKGTEPIYGTLVSAVRTTDAKKYMAAYRESLKLWNTVASRPENEGAMKWEVEEVEIEGATGKGMRLALDLSSLPGVAAAGPFLDFLFGPGGKLVMYAAPADAKTVFLTYVSKESLEHAIAEYKKGGKGLEGDEGLKKTAALLPSKATGVFYLNLGGLVTLVKRVVNMFAPGAVAQVPAFPEVPPVGGALTAVENGFEADIVYPIATTKAIADYVRTLQQNFNPN